MSQSSPFAALSSPLAAALAGRGFNALTPVQEAVLDRSLAGRDLRIRSQTGSGKTVAVGLVVAPELERSEAAQSEAPRESEGTDGPASARPRSLARPLVIMIAPTRELAAQLARELTWLYAPLKAGVAVVTGGSSYGGELRVLRSAPRVVVGTPGRLLDHLDRGSIDASGVRAVVLDEADQMLDLGFRDDLEAILARTPAERRTHLVSATFSREVLALADRYQRDPADAEGTRAGAANEDITHVAHLVRPADRDAALVNLLLLSPDERALVFVRTREGASTLADRLGKAGFSARAIHGDLDQRERSSTLEAFRAGAVTTLVATDVAARGLDVPDVGRVIHADPPGDSEALTHRSGRTGRAGRKGTSIVLVPPVARDYMTRLYRRARIEPSWEPAPSPDDVYRTADERLFEELTEAARRARARSEALASEGANEGDEAPESADAFAGDGDDAGAAEPPESTDARSTAISGDSRSKARLETLAERLLDEVDPFDLVVQLLAHANHAGPTAPLPVARIEPPRPSAAPQRRDRDREGGRPASGQGFVPFRINWGERHGADPRRLLAMVCRRGGIEGRDVGSIRIGPFASTFEVAAGAAAAFTQRVKKPDVRDPRIKIMPATVDRVRSSREGATPAWRDGRNAFKGAPRPRWQGHGGE